MTCPVCEGSKHWHKRDGTLCYSDNCQIDEITTCKYCAGTGFVDKSKFDDTMHELKELRNG